MLFLLHDERLVLHRWNRSFATTFATDIRIVDGTVHMVVVGIGAGSVAVGTAASSSAAGTATAATVIVVVIIVVCVVGGIVERLCILHR